MYRDRKSDPMWKEDEKKLQMGRRGLLEAGKCPKIRSDKFTNFDDYMD